MNRGRLFVSDHVSELHGERVREFFMHFELRIVERQPDMLSAGDWYICLSPAFEEPDCTYDMVLYPELKLEKVNG